MISKTTITHDIPLPWILVGKDELTSMSTPSLSTIHIIFRREVKGIVSFVTRPFEVRTEWINHRLTTSMAKAVKELYNLNGWEVVCYYYHKL
jgi:hypothetical protein